MKLLQFSLFLVCLITPVNTDAVENQCRADQTSAFQTAIAQIEKDILKELDRSKGPGISVSIFYQGNEILNQGYGIANTRKNLSVTPETLFKSASTSKVLVALAILRLEQQGKVELNAPISTYLKKLDRSLSDLTLRQLLSHTAGLKDQVNDFGSSGISRQIEYANDLDKDIFLTEPGEVFSYSNSGYNIVGAIIEAISDTDFDTAMKDLIFNRFDMSATTYRNDKVNETILAYGHNTSGTRVSMSSRLPDNARERASGMMLTTASEMNKVLRWLVSDQPSSDNGLKNDMLTTIADSRMTGSYFQYGAGLFHSVYCGYKSVWHTGGMPGYSAAFLAVPSEGFSIVILSNGEDVNRWNIISSAMRNLLSADCSPTATNIQLTTFSGKEIEALTGVYDQGFGRRIELLTTEDGFSLRQGSQTFEVRKNKKGQLVTMLNGKPQYTYGIYRNEQSQVKYLQYWVRAYPRLN